MSNRKVIINKSLKVISTQKQLAPSPHDEQRSSGSRPVKLCSDIIFLLEEEVISRDLCSAKYSFRELLTKY
jgi:hypothetical protein